MKVNGRQSLPLSVAALLDWFGQNARDLPWRNTLDPYGIWVSEVMLQQTQVQTVVPYWIRWMKQLPSIGTLAASSLEQVLKLWEGLGYYTRARQLHRAAHQIVQRHGGVFPQSYEAVLELPGIGPYTAGAVCSIAFDQPTAVLDGNVTRVLARFHAVRGSPQSKEAKTRLWRIAGQWVEAAEAFRSGHRRPCSSVNQALMELGATVCTPTQPNCPECPLRDGCVALRKGQTDRFPASIKRPQVTECRFAAFAIRHRNRWLVRQRPDGVVNAGLWEFPNWEELGPTEDAAKLAARCLGWEPLDWRDLCTIQHSITRFRIRLKVYLVKIPARANIQGIPGQWLTLRQVDRLALPSAHRKILHTLMEDRRAAARLGRG